jgi:N,N'-diacetyllegionaminate synthase
MNSVVPFFIAEAGVNHNGSLEMALKLVAEAKKCGADCIKFQTFQASEVASLSAPKAAYQLKTTARHESQVEMLQKLELPMHAWPQIMAACSREGIMFLSTPYGLNDVALLESLGAVAYKIASGQIVEPTFLRVVAGTGKPILLSTGMANLAEVDEAVRIIRSTAANFQPKQGHSILSPLTLLQCTTDYPSRIEDANLASIPIMTHAFGLPVGYSDHTEDVIAGIVAASLGARVFEKHFTLDRGLPGPDQFSSADPRQFRDFVTAIKTAISSLGSGIKQPCERERINLPHMRRGCVAARSLPKGTTLRSEDIVFRRPLRGVPAAQVDLLIGRVLTQSVSEGAFFDFQVSEVAEGSLK